MARGVVVYIIYVPVFFVVLFERNLNHRVRNMRVLSFIYIFEPCVGFCSMYINTSMELITAIWVCSMFISLRFAHVLWV